MFAQDMTAHQAITDLIRFLVLSFIVISGFVLSLFHVFTTREKSSFEKYCMGAFTIGANAVAAITVGMEEINSGSYTLIFFPLWNILIGMVLIFQIPWKPKCKVRIAFPAFQGFRAVVEVEGAFHVRLGQSLRGR